MPTRVRKASAGTSTGRKRVQPPPKGAGFRILQQNYLESHEALQELVNEIGPRVAELDSDDRRFAGIRQGFGLVPEEDRQALGRILAKHAGRTQKEIARLEKTTERPVEADMQLEDRRARISVPHFFQDLVETFPGRTWLAPFITGFVRTVVRPPRSPIFLTSVLVSAVSSFEVLIGGIVDGFFRLHPAALESADREKEFSLEDLKELGSVEDAVSLAISRRVEDFMWGGFDDWNRWFARNLKIEFNTICMDFDRLVEVIERRHIVIHHGGRVSRRYLSRVTADPKPTLGSDLRLDEAYVRDVLDHLVVFGTMLVVVAWAKLVKEEAQSAGRSLASVVYDQMFAGHWNVVEALCKARTIIDMDEESRWVFQCNEWLARKRTGRLTDIQAEIEKWDASALALRFRIVRLSLLDRVDEALKLVPQALASDELSRDSLFEWPILEELRASKKFRAVVVDELGAKRKTRNASVATTGGTPSTSITPLERGNKSRRVVTTRSGASFHRPGCSLLRGTIVTRTRAAALREGWKPCQRCGP